MNVNLIVPLIFVFTIALPIVILSLLINRVNRKFKRDTQGLKLLKASKCEYQKINESQIQEKAIRFRFFDYYRNPEIFRLEAETWYNSTENDFFCFELIPQAIKHSYYLIDKLAVFDIGGNALVRNGLEYYKEFKLKKLINISKSDYIKIAIALSKEMLGKIESYYPADSAFREAIDLAGKGINIQSRQAFSYWTDYFNSIAFDLVESGNRSIGYAIYTISDLCSAMTEDNMEAGLAVSARTVLSACKSEDGLNGLMSKKIHNHIMEILNLNQLKIADGD